LIKTIDQELEKDYNKFVVKIIQLFYDDNNKTYENIKEEEITNLVCV
jgi:hypothetical protein